MPISPILAQRYIGYVPQNPKPLISVLLKRTVDAVIQGVPKEERAGFIFGDENKIAQGFSYLYACLREKNQICDPTYKANAANSIISFLAGHKFVHPNEKSVQAYAEGLLHRPISDIVEIRNLSIKAKNAPQTVTRADIKTARKIRDKNEIIVEFFDTICPPELKKLFVNRAASNAQDKTQRTAQQILDIEDLVYSEAHDAQMTVQTLRRANSIFSKLKRLFKIGQNDFGERYCQYPTIPMPKIEKK